MEESGGDSWSRFYVECGGKIGKSDETKRSFVNGDKP